MNSNESWKSIYIKELMSRCEQKMTGISRAIEDADEEYFRRKWEGLIGSRPLGYCDFCCNFDFGAVRYEIHGRRAYIVSAGGSSKFDPGERFAYCPKCGKELNHNY
jgi:hypothetical protein